MERRMKRVSGDLYGTHSNVISLYIWLGSRTRIGTDGVTRLSANGVVAAGMHGHLTLVYFSPKKKGGIKQCKLSLGKLS
jgi:hypothetical protein